MSSVDDRIVRMQFDNAEFKKRAVETKQSLTDLNKATDAAGKGKGLMDLNSNMQRVSVTASKMAVVTTTALATIANKAVNVGLQLASSLTLDPIKSGFAEYESLLTKQNVIMNATGKSAGQVKKVLNDLNHYSDKTVFSFGDMTEALTSFVNAGVPLNKASQAMKGIANASALAGASQQEAQSSFRAFSQALGQGFLGLQDFRQAAVTGKIGTVQFKQTLIDAAVAAGTLTKKGKEYVTATGKSLTATKNFDYSLQEQWANTKVLNAALRNYADTNTVLGKKAFKAAQDVRTFSAFMDTLKESLSSGWSQVFTSLFGGLEESTAMWTGLSNAVGASVSKFFNWTATALQTWRTMGGFTKTIQGFKNILAPIGAIFDTIGTAFRSAFPNSGQGAGKGLYAVSAGFEAITRPLQLVADLIRLLTGPLTLFFQILKIGGAVVRQLVTWILDLAGGLADIVDIDAPKGGGFLKWLKDLGKALAKPIDQISDLLSKGKSLGKAFGSVDMPDLPSFKLPGFGGADKAGDAAAAGASKGASGLEKAGHVLKNVGRVVKEFSKDVADLVKGVFNSGDEISSFGGKIEAVFQKVGDVVRAIFDKIDWEKVLASFNLAVISTFLISLSRLANAVADGIKGVAGFGDAAKGVMEDAGSALKSFQTQARAKLILNIAIAVGILAVSLWVLSRIPADKLVQSLAAMGLVFIMLNKTMKSFTGLLESLQGKKVGPTALGVAIAIGFLAGAMILLATSMLIMNKVKWGSVVKGLVTMFTVMKLMESLGNTAAGAAKNMIAGAAGILVISFAMITLAGALMVFKLVDWGSMLKAGVVLAALVVSMLLLSKVPAPVLMGIAAAMLSISGAMLMLGAALLIFKLVEWESIGKLAVVLAALSISLALMMAVGGPVAVSGMLGLGAGLLAIAAGALVLNKVNWSSIAKLVVVLTILTVALAAIGVVSYFVGPALILLGVAMALLGVGLLAFAAAMAIAMTVAAAGTAAFAAFATGAAVAIAAFLTSLALQAPIMKDSFLVILQTLIDTIVEAVPMVIQGIKDLWKAIKKELGGDDKKKGSGEAGKSWMQSLMDGIKEKIPMLVEKGKDILVAWIKGMTVKAPLIGAQAAIFIAKFIGGIATKLGGIIESGANLIISWIKGITREGPRIADAAAKAVIKFINDMADSIEENSEQLVKAMGNLGTAMVKGLIKGVTDMAGDSLSAIGGLAKGMVDKAKSILKIFSPSRVFASIGRFLVMGLTNGIQDNASSAIRAVASMVSGQIAVANEYVSKYIQDLDQQALAARAKADGLAAAAKRAADLAAKTKNKKDDKAAENLQKRADEAAKQADTAEARAEKAKSDQDRADQMAQSSSIDKAKMRSEDAQAELDAAKASEADAARKRTQAAALERQANAKGLTKEQRKKLRDEAKALRRQAEADANSANAHLDAARTAAADALKYQKIAGDEAAAAFQAAFDSDAKQAEEEAAFEKMSDAEKADLRRKQAAELQTKAQKDLDDAKKLAYTDLEAANALAQQAQEEAQQAREYLDDAMQLEAKGADSSPSSGGNNGGVLGTVINLDPTERAARQMEDYSNRYDVGVAAAASDRTVEFNQYNTSPEALSPTEIYRQTNNLVTFAVDKLDEITGNN